MLYFLLIPPCGTTTDDIDDWSDIDHESDEEERGLSGIHEVVRRRALLNLHYILHQSCMLLQFQIVEYNKQKQKRSVRKTRQLQN